jgi:hypothetical protein
MAITATTLSAAAGKGDLIVNVASATGITAPNFTAGTGITFLMIDAEVLAVMGVNGTVVNVQRGINGSLASAHVNGAQVQIGLPGDFGPQGEFLQASTTSVQTELGVVWPGIFLAGSADAIPAGVAGFYVVKTAGVDAMTLAAPTAAQEGNIIQIWSDTTNAHTLTATSLLANGTALKTTATFPAFRGAGLTLRVCNLVYHVLSNGASAGVVVLT